MAFTYRLIISGVVLAAASSFALGETMPGQNGMGSPQMMQQHHPQLMMPMAGHPGVPARTTTPTMPGQDAFGAIQEITRMLEADLSTDWSKVNLEALRQHLIDMNEVTLKADAAAKPVDGGLEIAVTGTGRTVDAIQRMVPAHAHEIDQTHLNRDRSVGWRADIGMLVRVNYAGRRLQKLGQRIRYASFNLASIQFGAEPVAVFRFGYERFELRVRWSWQLSGSYPAAAS